jgi:hypothetical protein
MSSCLLTTSSQKYEESLHASTALVEMEYKGITYSHIVIKHESQFKALSENTDSFTY